jgi:hypothetical protein
MEKFIKKSSLFFIIPIVILGVLLEVFLRNIPNDYSYKNDYLDLKSNEIEVLFLGSSHVYFGINPEYSKFKSFNASHISQSLNFDLAILEKYKNKWSSLKCIVIPVDYFSMYKTLTNGIEKWRVKNYSIYYNIHKESYYKCNFEIFNNSLKMNWERLKSSYCNNSTDITCNKWGWGTIYNSKNSKDLIKTGMAAAKRHTVKSNADLCFEDNVKTLNSLVEFAKKNKIKIIFYTSPAYKTYVDNLEQKQLKRTIDLVSQKTSKNLNTVYYNLLNDKSFIAEDFYDADHLNEKGAKKLTFIMDSLIIANNKILNFQ